MIPLPCKMRYQNLQRTITALAFDPEKCALGGAYYCDMGSIKMWIPAASLFPITPHDQQ